MQRNTLTELHPQDLLAADLLYSHDLNYTYTASRRLLEIDHYSFTTIACIYWESYINLIDITMTSIKYAFLV